MSVSIIGNAAFSIHHIMPKYEDMFELTASGYWKSPLTQLLGREPWRKIKYDETTVLRCSIKWNSILPPLTSSFLKDRISYIIEAETKCLNTVMEIESLWTEYGRRLSSYDIDLRQSSIILRHIDAVVEKGLQIPIFVINMPSPYDVGTFSTLTEALNAREFKPEHYPLAKLGETPNRPLDLD